MVRTSGEEAKGGGREPRREQLTAAVLRIVATSGLDAVSVRRVAAEAGVSIGTVQHYFPTKDAMLAHAFRRTVERVEARVERVATEAAGRGVGPVLAAVLRELLPLDERRVAETRVWLAFVARAAVAPDLAAEAPQIADLRVELAKALELADSIGELREPVDAEREAAVLSALVHGLALHAAIDPAFSGGEAEATLAAYMDRLLRPLGGG